MIFAGYGAVFIARRVENCTENGGNKVGAKMKKSSKTPFIAAPDYGHSLSGFTVNLLSADLPRALTFQRDVLRAEILHEDEDLLIVRGYGRNWMVHADHTYDKHPLLADTQNETRRGAGVELRLHGCDPDGTAGRAQEHGFSVLDGPRDQPDHGLREAHIVDADGYVWVPDVPV
jgi:predicted enzyme related to lactoylglutathione lyase